VKEEEGEESRGGKVKTEKEKEVGINSSEKNLPPCLSIHHKWNPGLRGGKPATNRFSYGMAQNETEV
jgi:hypothetical protein